MEPKLETRVCVHFRTKGKVKAGLGRCVLAEVLSESEPNKMTKPKKKSS